MIEKTISGNGGNIMAKCTYCDNILKDHANKAICDEILFESKNFVVTTSLGAFIEGWILIISKKHITSMSQLSETEIKELAATISDIRNRVEQVYGPTVVFEHGSLTPGTHFGCGIDHAHVHIVPFENSIVPLIDQEPLNINWRPLNKIDDIIMENKPYLLVIDREERNGVISNPDNIPSQFMRRVLAKYLGITESFDYHQYMFIEKATATYQSLRHIFDYALKVG
jgi:ATP adenylyltransferase